MSAEEGPGKKVDWFRSQDTQQGWPERRYFDRYDIDTELIARLSFSGPAIMRGYSLDISINGIAGVFVTGWEVGTQVWLEFSLPTCTGRMQMQSVVRNRSGYRYGFGFVNLSGRERLLIQKACRVLALLE